MPQYLLNQIRAIAVAIVFAIVFIALHFVFNRVGLSDTVATELVKENSVPFTVSVLGLTVIGLYAIAVFATNTGATAFNKYITTFAADCHLFCLSAMWLTVFIAIYRDFSCCVVLRSIGITAYLALMSFVVRAERDKCKLYSSLAAFGYLLAFILSSLGVVSVLFSKIANAPQ